MTKRKKRQQAMNGVLLHKLLMAGDGYVSGSEIAKELGVTRVSVWGHMEKLRGEGFEFEAIRNKGYRLKEEPAGIHTDLLEAYLIKKKIEVSTVYRDETDSTMNEVERELASGRQGPFVVVSKKQTAGRGRHGRVWESNDKGNIYMSFGFQPKLSPQKMVSLTPLVAVNICELINISYNVNTKVKWPNDLILNGKKVCGMLAESRIDMDRMRDLVFGIGLNVNGSPNLWPEELQAIATTLEAGAGTKIRINEIAADIIGCVLEVFEKLEEEWDENEFLRLWQKHDSLHNKEVTGICGNETITGIVKGVNERGQLKLLQEDGTMKIVSVGEFSLRKEYLK